MFNFKIFITMKNFITLFIGLILSPVFSQTTNIFPPSGNVGLGTTSPTQKLHVLGRGYFAVDPSNLTITPNLPGVLINPREGAIELGSSLNTYTYIDFKGKDNLTEDYRGRIKYNDVSASGFSFHGHVFLGSSAIPVTMMVIRNDGKVGIGTQNPDAQLTVKGNIHAEEVKVDLLVPADYVFQKYYDGYSTLNPDYDLLTLQDIESYIKQNHRLPGVPSAQETHENGLLLGEMSNLLLEKIEELTLYIIEQHKRIEALESRIHKTE